MAAPKKKLVRKAHPRMKRVAKKANYIYTQGYEGEIGVTKKEALALMLAGRSREWNMYRETHPDWIPDLSGAYLASVSFVPIGKPPFDLSKANLCGATLPPAEEAYTRLEPGGHPRGGAKLEVNLKDAVVNADTKVTRKYDVIGHGAVIVSKSQATRIKSVTSVFISYAWANENVVLAVDQWLRNKEISTKIDKRDFFAGARIRDEILRVMIYCNVILIFYSKESKDKPWAEFERELASDLEMSAKQKGQKSPRVIYLVIDDTPLPSITESNRLAIIAKGKKFELVCEEIYHGILQLPKVTQGVDLKNWSDYVFG